MLLLILEKGLKAERWHLLSSMAGEMSGDLHGLCVELLLEICGWVSPSDIRNMSQVCSYFRQIITTYEPKLALTIGTRCLPAYSEAFAPGRFGYNEEPSLHWLEGLQRRAMAVNRLGESSHGIRNTSLSKEAFELAWIRISCLSEASGGFNKVNTLRVCTATDLENIALVLVNLPEGKTSWGPAVYALKHGPRGVLAWMDRGGPAQVDLNGYDLLDLSGAIVYLTDRLNCDSSE